jgi:hypothetical protein
MLLKHENMEEYIKKCLLSNESYIFGNIESSWMGSTGLFSTEETTFISLTAVIKFNNYYVQGNISASSKVYTKDDVSKLETLLSNWVINFKKLNNI